MRAMWIAAAIMFAVSAVMAGVYTVSSLPDRRPSTAASAALPAPDAAGRVFDPIQPADAGPTATGPWTAYRHFLFDFDRADIPFEDRKKIAEIAAYMAANPAARLGIDGAVAPNGNGLRNQPLSDRRIAAVHDALIAAGVPAGKIALGTFTDPTLKRDRQIDVVLRTDL